MKSPTFSPVFASMYVRLCELTRAHGYALTVHGTMSLDFDLVAIPWTNEAVEEHTLAKLIAEELNMFAGEGFEKFHETPVLKPHGRLSWILYFGNHAYIDLSVMSRGK